MPRHLRFGHDLRGVHDRDAITVCIPRDGLIVEVDVVHEEGHPVYGKMSIGNIPSDFRSLQGNRYVSIWRPSRRHTSDIHTVSVGGPYMTLEDAVEDLQHAAKKANKHAEKAKGVNMRRTANRRPRDSQRSKMYKWERDEPLLRNLWKSMPEDDVVKFFDKVVNEEFKYGHKPTLTFRSGGRSSYGSIFGIRLLPCHHNKHIVLHELAHTMTFHDNMDKQIAGHGAEFMGMLVYLLVKHCNVDYSSLRESINQAKLKCDMPKCYWKWVQRQKEAKAA